MALTCDSVDFCVTNVITIKGSSYSLATHSRRATCRLSWAAKLKRVSRLEIAALLILKAVCGQVTVTKQDNHFLVVTAMMKKSTDHPASTMSVELRSDFSHARRDMH